VGSVVIRFAERTVPPAAHEIAALQHVAGTLARVLGYEFHGPYEKSRWYERPLYVVPDDALLPWEARELGIESPGDLFGSVVPADLVRTKVINHPLVSETAVRPDAWGTAFPRRVAAHVLPGFTAFSRADAAIAALRLLEHGPLRIKHPLAAGGRKQWVACDPREVAAIVDRVSDEDLLRHGLVLERNLAEIRTLSVGRVSVGAWTVTYHGLQQLTRDHTGAEVYGGSDLFCVRGDWEALARLAVPVHVAEAIRQARAYDAATVELGGFLASRRNYDVACGRDAGGRPHCGVLEASWRAGGASGAEAAALAAFAEDPTLGAIAVSSVEVFGRDVAVPADALVHFSGVDPEIGALTRYVVVGQRSRRAA
jgi:hypothetical protein